MLLTMGGPVDERQLIERMRAGDGEALAEIVRRYQSRVFALIYGIVRDRHEVEDVAQEVFFKVFRRVDAFDGRSKFYTWLYRVAANAAKDHVKKRSRRPAVALEEDAVLPDSADGPEGEAQRVERRQQVRDAIAALSPTHREVLTLREIEQLSYKEIADVLELSIGTVESRLHRARAQLKRRLMRHV